ncbi:MAG: hypothetical protein J0H44_22150 [Alphaproteobacteria bacterium]|nr:hypothetical protein [Alphaproteobacteria bacterium]
MDGAEKQIEPAIGGNVTFDPLAAALPVDEPAIREALDCDTGEFVDVKAWIGGQRYEELIAQRVSIRERLSKNPRFRCSLCSVPVYLVANQFKHFFFRHITEDGSCPAETRSPLSRDEILARKYDGVRESEPHKRIKALIMRSLSADPSFSEILSERQWRSSHDERSRRQPDVQATRPMGRTAFEVQLSTTFLDVVAGRRSFYRQEDALLVWVMGKFDPDYRRLTTDDLLFTNNSNILVVDEETATLSEAVRRFHVRCHFRRPAREGDRLTDRWESRVIPFSELTCEKESQRCWYFDYDRQASAIRAEIDKELQERERATLDALRSELLSFWLSRKPNAAPDKNEVRAWTALREALSERGVSLPSSPDEDSGFIALMNGVASAKEGKPVGWNFKHLVEVAHRIADGYPQHVVAFGHAARLFKRDEMLAEQDRTGKWKRRSAAIGASLRNGQPDFAPDPASILLVDFLMPGTKAKLEKINLAYVPAVSSVVTAS